MTVSDVGGKHGTVLVRGAFVHKSKLPPFPNPSRSHGLCTFKRIHGKWSGIRLLRGRSLGRNPKRG